MFPTCPIPRVTRMRSIQRQQGASMIEVLVAVLLVSIGLLGIAGLSGATFSYNKTSQVRLTGMALVNDFADRARLNVAGYDRGGYSIALGDNYQSSPVTVAASNLGLDPSVAVNGNKIADDLAAADVDQFLRSVRSRLPLGDAVVVSRPSGATRDMDVWLLWQQPQVGSGSADDLKTSDYQLFMAGQGNCPNSLSAADKLVYSCMYFKVGL
ncbi:type IV pilus modification protein PilV [Hydrogenophaga sp. MI9]|uniref:type IV pilus modification protein PilV n=1 Tax=Hydrogenophaga sp. MI9 TaxID=3453719 RepID=UPI003EEAA745